MSASKSFWAGAAVGGAVMAYGVAGLVGAARRTHPVEVATYVVGAALAHDLLVAPVALVVAAAMRRLVPGRLRQPILSVLIASAIVALFAFPFVRGYGRNPANPSVLPGNYATGLVTVLLLVAVGGGLWAVIDRRGARRR